MHTSATRQAHKPTAGNPRGLKVAAMLLLPLLIAIVACDNSTTPTASPTATTAASKPYSNSPEGKPPGLSAPVPDPVEATETKPAGQLPSFISQASAGERAKITAVYQGAIDHYDAYSQIPCYCGCAVYMHAHMSLAQCYVQSKGADGAMTFTNHSLSCDICQGVAKMTVDGLAQKTPLKDVRAAIFTKFKYTGIWTDTPFAP